MLAIETEFNTLISFSNKIELWTTSRAMEALVVQPRPVERTGMVTGPKE